jgi:hypothetical protein
MALSRYGQLQFSNLRDLKTPQVPWEQIDLMLAGAQQQKNLYSQMANVSPKYITESKADATLAKQVSQYQKEVKDQLTQIAATGNARDYLTALQQVQDNIRELWRPGGVADVLESRHAQFQNEQKRIQDATEKYKNPLYKGYFTKDLISQLDEKDIYNVATGASKSIKPVNIFAEVNTGEEIDKYFKDYAKAKNVDIGRWTNPTTGKFDPYYMAKYSIEGISKEDAQNALNSFYDQPHIKQALEVEKWSMKRNYTPEQLQKLEESGKQQLLIKWNAIKEQGLATLKTYKDNPNDPFVQQTLKSAGYETVDDYEKEFMDNLERSEEAVNNKKVSSDEIILEQVKQKYTEAYVPKYTATKKDIDLILYQPAMEALKHSYRKKENSQYLANIERMLASDEQTFFNEVDVQNVPLTGAFKSFNEAQDTYQNVLQMAEKDTAFKDMWSNVKGINNLDMPEQALLIRSAIMEATDENGKINPGTFQSHINSNGGTITPERAKQLANYFESTQNRTTLSRYVDFTETPLKNKQNTQATVEEALNNLTDNEWTQIIGKTGIGVKRTVAYSGAGRVQQETYDINAIKQAAYSGNTKVMEALQDLDKEVKSSNVVTVFKNSDLGTLDGTMTKMVSDFMPSYIGENFMYMSEKQLNSMGYDKKGNVLDDNDGRSPVSSVYMSAVLNKATGQNEIKYVVNGAYGNSPVILSPNKLNKQFNDAYIMNLASKEVNPTTLEITNQTNFNTVASMWFDHNVNVGGLTLERVRDSWGVENREIGSFKDPARGERIITRIMTNSEDNTPYLIGIREADMGTMNKYKKSTGYDLNKFKRENPYSEKIPLYNNDANTLLEGIQQFKAGWGKVAIQKHFMDNPIKATMSKSNVTGNQEILRTAAMRQQQYNDN